MDLPFVDDDAFDELRRRAVDTGPVEPYHHEVDMAVGTLMVRHGISADAAHASIAAQAEERSLDELEVARAILAERA